MPTPLWLPVFILIYKFLMKKADAAQELDINVDQVAWQNLNNNYITYQFYHIAMDPTTGYGA